MGAAMVCFLLSLVGVPPLAGFAVKLLLFGAALDAGFAWLAAVAILNSVLSLAVYLRIIAPMYSSPGLPKALVRRPSTVAVTGVALALTLALGLAARIFLPDRAALTALGAGPQVSTSAITPVT
jgi:NADH-quinone oxidoreductase subunit N